MDEVRAAMKARAKKAPPMKLPAGIVEKTCGRAVKIRPSPAAGSIPTMKTIGKIIRPAIRATIVSAETIRTDEEPILESRGR